MNFWNGVSNLFRQSENRPSIYDEKEETSSEVKEKNPNIDVFGSIQNNIAEIIDKRSVITQYESQNTIQDLQFYSPFQTSIYAGITALPLLTNKGDRVKQYRSMASYPECDFCICELADDVIHEDEMGEFIHLKLPDSKENLNEDRKDILLAEFRKVIELFKFKDDGYNLVKKFLIDGEIAFENIIDSSRPDLGILGVKYLPTEYYETLISQDSGKPIGIIFDKEKLTKDLNMIISSSCLGSSTIFNTMISTQQVGVLSDNCIPLLYPQITYISSGDTSADGLISFPLIEKCKTAYHQLALMQDSAVILRVTRAPERLLFNINCGNMPEKRARQYIQELKNQLKSKKIVSSNLDRNGGQAEVTTVYDPVSMLEVYFAGMVGENKGTTIESVGSSADYEQIADIEFFLRRLFKCFKVPFSRYKTAENSLERDETITYEEYSMARYIIRIQRRFAMALKRTFITHLKLRGLWKQYSLRENDINVEFVVPILYDLYQSQKLITAKMETYKTIVDQEEFSKIIAMKKILKMSDTEIEDNFKSLIKEKQLVALADYFAEKISDDNKPVDYASPIRLEGLDGIPHLSKNSADGDEESSGDDGMPPSDDQKDDDDGEKSLPKLGNVAFGMS